MQDTSFEAVSANDQAHDLIGSVKMRCALGSRQNRPAISIWRVCRRHSAMVSEAVAAALAAAVGCCLPEENAR